MPSLPIVITGTGRSGTTFLTHVFAKAGMDVGDVLIDLIGVKPRATGGGLEWSEFAKVNRFILKRLQEGVTPSAVAEEIMPMIPSRFPAVIKHPLYIATFHVWQIAGYTPKHIFLCMRNPDATQQSFQKSFNGEGEINYHMSAAYALLAYALQNAIPITPIAYPRIGQDAAYADRCLAPFIERASQYTQGIWDNALQSCKPQEHSQKILQNLLVNRKKAL